MIELGRSQYSDAFQAYRRTEVFFPLIGAVLLGEQDGIVYTDNAAAPNQYYVEHHFGFTQIFGDSQEAFENALRRHLLEQKAFAGPNKVRLYTPRSPSFLEAPQWKCLRSFRQRFKLTPDTDSRRRLNEINSATDFTATDVDETNVEEVDRQFGVVKRFWRSEEDFIRRSHSVVALSQGRLASICYAAAEADRRAEIDVLTLPEFRGLGAGKFAVAQFSARCFERSLEPLWDCFTNNAGSMQLCRSVGFEPSGSPYQFFTINRSLIPSVATS